MNISFSYPEFPTMIRSGRKIHTIRAVWRNGKFPFEKGMPLQLWYKQRDPKRGRKIADAECRGVFKIGIHSGYIETKCPVYDQLNTGLTTSPQVLQKLAYNDGFDSYIELYEALKSGLPDHEHAKMDDLRLIFWRLK